jgi:hypothetical protein
MFLAMFDRLSAAKKIPLCAAFRKRDVRSGVPLTARDDWSAGIFSVLEKARLGEIFAYSDNRRIMS